MKFPDNKEIISIWSQPDISEEYFSCSGIEFIATTDAEKAIFAPPNLEELCFWVDVGSFVNGRVKTVGEVLASIVRATYCFNAGIELGKVQKPRYICGFTNEKMATYAIKRLGCTDGTGALKSEYRNASKFDVYAKRIAISIVECSYTLPQERLMIEGILENQSVEEAQRLIDMVADLSDAGFVQPLQQQDALAQLAIYQKELLDSCCDESYFVFAEYDVVLTAVLSKLSARLDRHGIKQRI